MKDDKCLDFFPSPRRDFLKRAGVLSLVAVSAGCQRAGSHAEKHETSDQALRNAVALGDKFAIWQSSYGSPDLVKCPYRTETPNYFNAYNLHSSGPAARALYRLYRDTGVVEYKVAADRYATFLMTTLEDRVQPSVWQVTLNGNERSLLSSAWMYGKGLSPAYEWFCLYNPHEDAYELKAYALHRWLQIHRRPDSYFGVGYPCDTQPDCQFSCDLAELGYGLMGFYEVSHYGPALEDARGLAKFFLTEYQDGSGRGVWSSRLGTWLVGPWPGSHGEHFTGQNYNEVGWGWSAYLAAEYLLRLHQYTEDPQTRSSIEDKCVKSFRWCFDACQFEDGGHGMFGRDDKWVGMAAAAIMLYSELRQAKAMPADIEAAYRPRVDKTWRWLLENTNPENSPPDGYVKVNGTSSKKPLENLFWLMAFTVEGLLEGRKIFQTPPAS